MSLDNFYPQNSYPTKFKMAAAVILKITFLAISHPLLHIFAPNLIIGWKQGSESHLPSKFAYAKNLRWRKLPFWSQLFGGYSCHLSLNISTTIEDTGFLPSRSLLESSQGESNGDIIDDVTWPSDVTFVTSQRLKCFFNSSCLTIIIFHFMGYFRRLPLTAHPTPLPWPRSLFEKNIWVPCRDFSVPTEACLPNLKFVYVTFLGTIST